MGISGVPQCFPVRDIEHTTAGMFCISSSCDTMMSDVSEELGSEYSRPPTLNQGLSSFMLRMYIAFPHNYSILWSCAWIYFMTYGVGLVLIGSLVFKGEQKIPHFSLWQSAFSE